MSRDILRSGSLSRVVMVAVIVVAVVGLVVGVAILVVAIGVVDRAAV